MLRYRLILGPLMAALMLGLVWLDGWLDGVAAPGWLGAFTDGVTWPPGVFVAPFGFVVAALAGRELARLLRAKEIDASTLLTQIVAVAGVAALTFTRGRGSDAQGSMLVTACLALTTFGSMAFYARSRDLRGVAAATAGAVLSFVFIGLMLGALVAVRREHSAWVLAWVVLSTKMADVGAFFVGRAFGRRKLAVWLSPGKTWEGLAGAVGASMVVAVAGAVALRAAGVEGSPGWPTAAWCGALFAVVGHAGDLMVSVLKRDAGAKDAGGSLPGFGGVLDVLDSVLLVGPAAYWALRLSGVAE